MVIGTMVQKRSLREGVERKEKIEDHTCVQQHLRGEPRRESRKEQRESSETGGRKVRRKQCHSHQGSKGTSSEGKVLTLNLEEV